MSESFKIDGIEIGLGKAFFVMAGPCVIESLEHSLEIAEILKNISAEVEVPIIFKASFDKANRSSVSSYRGPGIDKGLEILAKVKEKTGMAVMTDVHEPSQAAQVAGYVDCLQIPAFLCRQTDLLVACGKTDKPVNVKKGQFMSPAEMKNVVEKVSSQGNKKIMLTERGTFFGYNCLVNDFTGIPLMKELDCPVIFDVTHSTQKPGGFGNASAGNREMGPTLAKAAVAAGVNGLFIEAHNDPANAKSDAACVMPTEWLKELLIQCKQIHGIVG